MSQQRVHMTVETEDGPVEVSVNRRGCTREWTPQDAEAMAALVRAAVAKYSKPADSPCFCGRPLSEHFGRYCFKDKRGGAVFTAKDFAAASTPHPEPR